MLSKKHFLQKLTSQTSFKSLTLDSTNFEGTSPPSVFIGRENYPKVFAGPMLSQEPECFIYDAPERWLGNFEKEQIINFRLNLLRGKKLTNVYDVFNRFALQLQEIALSKNSVFSHAEFEKVPRGVSFNEEHAPFGPSAELKNLEADTGKWQNDLEKAYHDTDLLASDAVVEMNNKGIQFTTIQKALSTGAFGKLSNRKLVPTRWSITATDDILAKNALKDVMQNEVIEDYRVYESQGLNNYFAVMLTPTPWQYEAIEAFINIMDNKTYMFSDYERFFGRKEYSDMGGCYYAQRNAIAEKLKQTNEQAGAFVFREVYEGYVPTGVWVCRELTKSALNTEPKTFENLSDATHYMDNKLKLGVPKIRKNMPLLQQVKSQRKLNEYF